MIHIFQHLQLATFFQKQLDRKMASWFHPSLTANKPMVERAAHWDLRDLISSRHTWPKHPIETWISEMEYHYQIEVTTRQSLKHHLNVHAGVSKNRGTPKSSILIGFSIINHPFWGTPIFGNTHVWYLFILFLASISGLRSRRFTLAEIPRSAES